MIYRQTGSFSIGMTIVAGRARIRVPRDDALVGEVHSGLVVLMAVQTGEGCPSGSGGMTCSASVPFTIVRPRKNRKRGVMVHNSSGFASVGMTAVAGLAGVHISRHRVQMSVIHELLAVLVAGDTTELRVVAGHGVAGHAGVPFAVVNSGENRKHGVVIG